MNINTYLVGYLFPMFVTLFTFRKEPFDNLKIIVLIALCPIANIVGFLFSIIVLAREMNKRGYLYLSDD